MNTQTPQEEHKVSPFITKLFEALEDKENKAYIGWNEDGCSFNIKDINEFSSVILPKYYKHKNYSSFVRQLNLYKFKKNQYEENSFKHKFFRKSKGHLLVKIKRFASDSKKKQASKKATKASLDLNNGEHSFNGESNVTMKKGSMDAFKRERTHSPYYLSGSDTETSFQNEISEFRASQEKMNEKLEMMEKINQDAQMHSRALFEEFFKMRAKEEKLQATIKEISVEVSKLREEDQKTAKKVQLSTEESMREETPKLFHTNMNLFECSPFCGIPKAINRDYSNKGNLDDELLYQSTNQNSYPADSNTANNDFANLFDYKQSNESLLKGVEDCFPEKEEMGLIFEPLFLQRMESL